SATVEQELSAGFKGVSISAYREATSATRGLGTALAPYDFGGSNTFQKDYDISQEFRLLSPESRRFNYLIGAFYYKSSPSATTRLFRGSEYFPTTFRGAYSQRTSLVHDELWAVYGNATFRPIDQIAINGGLRYNYNRKDVYFVQDPAGLAGQGYANVPRYTDKLHEASLSPLVSVTFTPVEDINIYALYSTGKRPGGWNVDLVTTSQLQATRGSLEFDSESVKNYEAGVKMFLFDHRLRLNISAYHERFTNFQVTQFNSIPLPGGGLVSASQISNAALATSKGVEVDFDAAVTAGLHFTGGVGFNHAYFNSFPNAFQISAGPPPVFGAYTGNTLIEAPRFQGSLTSTYKWQLNSKIDGNASLSYTYRSRTYSDPSNGPDFTQKGFATVAARLAFANTSGEELAFFARNLFDAKYIEARGRSGAAVPFITYNQPRTLGIELTLRN
ncbi:MAG: TonB-dependent receptor, partial [Phenylobacterium sp.]